MENDEGVVLRTMKGHAKDVTCASCSLTLKLLATSGADGHIFVWNYGLGLLEGLCKGHSQDVTHLAFLEPYPSLLSTDILGNICVWGMPPGPVEHRFSTVEHLTSRASCRVCGAPEPVKHRFFKSRVT